MLKVARETLIGPQKTSMFYENWGGHYRHVVYVRH
jgi:hypothetical protein